MGVKSDLLNREIIYRFGGVYVDVDYECLQSLDVFLCQIQACLGQFYNGEECPISCKIYCFSSRNTFLNVFQQAVDQKYLLVD